METDFYTNIVSRPDLATLRPSDIEIFDTTLRDGEQTPGVAFTTNDKIRVAKKLVEVGVLHFEGGFPGASRGERAAFRALMDLALPAEIVAVCRLRDEDINASLDSGARSLALFIGSSDLHLQKKLRMTVEDAEDRIRRGVDYAVARGCIVSFGCEDASRTPIERLSRFFRAAIDSGAVRVGFADTLGLMTPTGMKKAVRRLKRSIGNAKLAVHCHNDYGLGTANSLAAIEEGIDQVHVGVNGIGERCGNVPLEEIVMILKYQYGVDLGINLGAMYELSKLIYELIGESPPFNKPIVGRNCFRHESGIHVHGLLSDPRVYEPFPPHVLGREHEVVLGKHSGVSNINYLIAKGLLPNLSESDKQSILERVKDLICSGQRLDVSQIASLVPERRLVVSR